MSGIELSGAMAARIASKPGGEAVEVTIGDMTTTRVAGAGEFSLVYLVFNTISNVTTQDGQVDVFRNAAAHLRPGGLFLIEVGLPGPASPTTRTGHRPVRGGARRRRRRLCRVRPVRRRHAGVQSNHVTVSPDGTGRFRRIPFRYAWPAEMDLMARIAGMRLKYRWADWDRSELTAESTKHVSVWEKT